MMTTKQYVKKYKLDDLQYSNHFNTDLFLQDLNDEMVERVNKEKENRSKAGLEYSYRIFQQIAQEMQQKFCAISNKKVGGSLRQALWNAFYAKYIIPMRAVDFPAKHEEIRIKRENYLKQKIYEEVVDDWGRENYIETKARAKTTGDYKEFDDLRHRIQAEVDIRFRARVRD